MFIEVELHKNELVALCQRFQVNRLEIFGSAVTAEFDPATSDLDFIASFTAADQPGYARRYLNFADSLERLFGRPVDLLTERSISNPFFRESVNRTRTTIYEDRSEKVVA